MCLLASMMLDKEMVGQIVQIVDREAFYQADHQIIFDVLVKLYEQNRPIDAVIVREELTKRQLLEEIGGVAYLAQILNSVPSAAHGAHYAASSARRRCCGSSSPPATTSSATPTPRTSRPTSCSTRPRRRSSRSPRRKSAARWSPMEDVLHEVFEMIENRGQRGIETGFFELDDMLNGLQNGEMIIVAARPSMGKTAFAMNIIEHIAADTRLPCAVFSLEMSKQQLAQRMLCSRGQIDAHKLRKGLLQSHEYAHLANVVGELAKAPIWVDDSPGLTLLELRAKARRLKLQHDIKCIMIDYMQLMDNPGVESRQQQISEISPRHQGGRPRAERAGDLPLAAQSRQRRPRRPPPAHERPARIRLASSRTPT